MALHLRGTRLPEREPVELWTDDGRLSFRPVAGARTLTTEGFILPGLVDAHTHPGAPGPGRPLDEALLRDDLRAHRAAGVTALRAMGATIRL
ncbi:MAG TPA: amidohydrolase, partial [Pseudonocardiaceae bacterium]|nr:amidohydrolase [Pseudonocardiaceae bacterium]